MSVYDDIAAERVRAHAKHGANGTSCEDLGPDSCLWLPILSEEVGEVAREICEGGPFGADFVLLRAELIQVAAMAAAWADACSRALEDAE